MYDVRQVALARAETNPRGTAVKISREIIQALAVTAEITGTQFSEAAARVFAQDIARYPEDQVLGALDRCRREVRGRLTVADVVTRLDDGRPAPDEAWAMLPHDERQSVVWTDEMSRAWGIASALEDRIAARMAFLVSYKRMVQDARDCAQPVKWWASLGSDARGRQAALEDAVRLGRISAPAASALLPAPLEVHPTITLPTIKTLQ